jgi:hypothetical protein
MYCALPFNYFSLVFTIQAIGIGLLFLKRYGD